MAGRLGQPGTYIMRLCHNSRVQHLGTSSHEPHSQPATAAKQAESALAHQPPPPAHPPDSKLWSMTTLVSRSSRWGAPARMLLCQDGQEQDTWG